MYTGAVDAAFALEVDASGCCCGEAVAGTLPAELTWLVGWVGKLASWLRAEKQKERSSQLTNFAWMLFAKGGARDLLGCFGCTK